MDFLLCTTPFTIVRTSTENQNGFVKPPISLKDLFSQENLKKKLKNELKRPMLRMSNQLQLNTLALEKFKRTYPNVSDGFSQDPTGAISYLRLLGFRCVNCSGKITGPNFEYFHFDPKTYCYTCQNTSFTNLKYVPVR